MDAGRGIQFDQIIKVAGHTPLESYPKDSNTTFADRRDFGACLSFSPKWSRAEEGEGGLFEPWVTISSNPDECAIVDIEVSSKDSEEHFIHMHSRADGAPVTTGYLGTRGETIDIKTKNSNYLTVTSDRISSWKITAFADGHFIQQADNSNGAGIDFFLLASYDIVNPIKNDNATSNLIF